MQCILFDMKVFLTLAAIWACIEAKRDYTAYCGACKAVIDEVRYSISKEDQYKTIQTGNFRVDSHGKQGGIKEVKFAGSETHISELLEKVCEQMQNYGETSDPQTGKKGYMRINSRAGETITISNVNFSSGGAQQLRAACDYFVSEFEEDLVSTLKAGDMSQEEMEEELCDDITGMDNIQQVQFRCVNSQYTARELVTVSYRYAIGGDFVASSQDLVGVYPENATSPEESLVSVSIGDPTRHRLCDGGLYQAGFVTVNCPEVEKAIGCKFWYISSMTGQAVGKSSTFMLCADNAEHLSGCFDSQDDQSMLSDMHTCSISASYVNIGETFNSAPSTLGSSFVIVSEESSCEVSGSEYIMAQAEDTSKAEIGNGSDDTRACNSRSEKCSDRGDHGCVAGEEGVTHDIPGSVSGLVLPSNPPKCPPYTDMTTIRSVGEDGNSASTTTGKESAERGAVMALDIPSSLIPCDSLKWTPFTDTDPTATVLSEGEGGKVECAEVMVAPDPTEMQLSSSNEMSLKNITSEAEHYNGLKSSSASSVSSPLDCAEVAEMSSSTVVVEKHVTQREARMLKTSNKELRSKVQKLSEILEQKKIMIEGLVKTASENERRFLEVQDHEKMFEAVKQELNDNVSSFKRRLLEQDEHVKEQKEHIQALQKQAERSQDGQREAESLNKKLLSEKTALEDKVKQLLQEKKTIFDRSTKLLTQLLDSETKREVEKSEKKVLQVKIDYLGDELRRIKLSQTKGEIVSSERQRQSSGQEVKQLPRFESTMLPLNSKHQNMVQSMERSTERASRRPRNYAAPPPSQQHHQSKERPWLHKPESSTSQLPPTTSTARPKDLPLGGAAPPSAHYHGRLVQPSGGRRELPTSSGGGAYSNQKQARARLDQGVPLKSGRTNGAGNTLPPVDLRHDDYQTLQEEGFAARREGGAALGEPAKGCVVMVECPICGKQLPSRENDFEVMLHVEHCIQISEMTTT